jgi:hypothetical protein
LTLATYSPGANYKIKLEMEWSQVGWLVCCFFVIENVTGLSGGSGGGGKKNKKLEVWALLPV